MQHQVLRDTVDVFGGERIVDDLGAAINIVGEPAAESDFALDRIELYRALVDVAFADQRRVVLVTHCFRRCARRRFRRRFTRALRECAGGGESERQNQRSGVPEKSRLHSVSPLPDYPYKSYGWIFRAANYKSI